MNELAENRISSTIAEIRGTCDIDKAIAMIKQLKGLQAALDSVGTFRDQSIKYAILHVEALVKVVELGGAGKLKGYEAKAALWLKDMSETERAHYIEMCKDGMLITQVWKREVGNKEKEQQAAKDALQLREWVIEDALENGEVNISKHGEDVARAGLSPILVRDFVDGTRNALLKAGAYGLGFGSGDYILPTKNNEDKMYGVLKNRYRSARADLMKIANVIFFSGEEGVQFCVGERYFEDKPISKISDGAEKIVVSHLTAIITELLDLQKEVGSSN